MTNNKKCPTCRANVSTLANSVIVDNYIDKVVDTFFNQEDVESGKRKTLLLYQLLNEVPKHLPAVIVGTPEGMANLNSLTKVLDRLGEQGRD
jgi:hypothetical protein